MANNFRTDRVGMEIKREVNEILQKKVRDPRVQGVTITDVQMLGDLSMACFLDSNGSSSFIF